MEQQSTLSRSRHLNRQKTTHRSSRPKRIGSVLGLFSLALMLLVITAFAYTYYKLDDAWGKIYEPSILSSGGGNGSHISDIQPAPIIGGNTPSAPFSREEKENAPFSVVVVGIDNREGSGGTLNADVIMIAVINPETHQVQLLSIPRDTKVTIPGFSGFRKANAAYALGEATRRQQERENKTVTVTGISLIQEMLSQYLQIPIDYYVSVDFKGFEEVVDAVGGVEIHVKREMIYDSEADGTHIHLLPGRQVLNGKKALDYVRYRLDNRGLAYQASDFDRNERQQEVIRAVLKKLTSFSGAIRINSVVDAVVENTRTDIPVKTVRKLALDIRSYTPENIITLENNAYWDSAQAFSLIPDTTLQALRNQLIQLMELQ